MENIFDNTASYLGPEDENEENTETVSEESQDDEVSAESDEQ